jgi:ATP-dependent Clp protease ATP-binding subunit ClpA
MLRREDLEKIVHIQLDYLAGRLKSRGLDVEFTPSACKQIIDEGYDPAYGARPLKRTIQQRLENRLATELLSGNFSEGDKIKIDTENQRFIFTKV